MKPETMHGSVYAGCSTEDCDQVYHVSFSFDSEVLTKITAEEIMLSMMREQLNKLQDSKCPKCGAE